MATKGEKIGFTIAGMFLGAAVNIIRKSNQAYENDKDYNWQDGLRDGLIGGTVGGAAGKLGAEFFGSPDDTVNYQLLDKRERVYLGISYEDRIDQRISEHKVCGKEFTQVEFDEPKPRSEALKLEKKLIEQHRPKYNIQHNS